MNTLLAQITNPVLPPSIGGGTSPTRDMGGIATGKIISGIIGGMFIVAFFIALIYLITGAFHWITSGGDKNNLEAARNKITHAIVGLIIVGAAWSIMVLVANFFGLDFTNLPIPSIDSVIDTGMNIIGPGGGKR